MTSPLPDLGPPRSAAEAHERRNIWTATWLATAALAVILVIALFAVSGLSCGGPGADQTPSVGESRPAGASVPDVQAAS